MRVINLTGAKNFIDADGTKYEAVDQDGNALDHEVSNTIAKALLPLKNSLDIPYFTLSIAGIEDDEDEDEDELDDGPSTDPDSDDSDPDPDVPVVEEVVKPKAKTTIKVGGKKGGGKTETAVSV